MNLDTEIVYKILANRIQQCVKTITCYNHTGFISYARLFQYSKINQCNPPY